MYENIVPVDRLQLRDRINTLQQPAIGQVDPAEWQRRNAAAIEEMLKQLRSQYQTVATARSGGFRPGLGQTPGLGGGIPPYTPPVGLPEEEIADTGGRSILSKLAHNPVTGMGAIGLAKKAGVLKFLSPAAGLMGLFKKKKKKKAAAAAS